MAQIHLPKKKRGGAGRVGPFKVDMCGSGTTGNTVSRISKQLDTF